MSNAATLLCRPLQLPPTLKAVLMALADYAHDDGRDWHSIASLMAWTCLGKTTVIDALKGLEARGLIVIERTFGRPSVTTLQLARIESEATANQCATRTGAAPVPVRQPDGTGAPPVRTGAAPVQTGAPPAPEALEASGSIKKHKSARARAPSMPCPPDVSETVWADWLQLRKAKKAPVTSTTVAGARAEASKAGLTLEDFLRVWCLRGTQGLQADWLKPNERRTRPANPSFKATDYTEGLPGE